MGSASSRPARITASSHGAIKLFRALDDKLAAALASGAIKLLRADFLRTDELPQILRRQDLEKREREGGHTRIFLSAAEAVAAFRSNGRKIGVLT